MLTTKIMPPSASGPAQEWSVYTMERIKTLETRSLCESAKNGGWGGGQTSRQSACKTSCTVGNQSCKNNGEKVNVTRKPLI